MGALLVISVGCVRPTMHCPIYVKKHEQLDDKRGLMKGTMKDRLFIYLFSRSIFFYKSRKLMIIDRVDLAGIC